jgi:hypothetical protein
MNYPPPKKAETQGKPAVQATPERRTMRYEKPGYLLPIRKRSGHDCPDQEIKRRVCFSRTT